MKKRQSIASRYSGLSYASAAKKISDKYKERDTDPIAQRSFMMEMEQLMRMQELQKLSEISAEKISSNRTQRPASKMDPGGWLPMQSKPLPVLPLNSGIFGMPGQRSTSEMLSDVGHKPFLDLRQGNWNAGVVGQRSTSEMLMDIGDTDPTSTLLKSSTKPFVQNPYLTKDGRAPETAPTKGSSMFLPLALGKGAEFAGKLAMAASGYDKVSPEYNPYESEIRRNMSSRGISLDSAKNAILSNQNAAAAGAAGMTSMPVRQALLQNTYRQGMDALSGTSLQQQQINNQYKADSAQMLNNLGSQKVQANQYAEQLNNQSKAGYQMGLQSMLESVGGIGQELTNYRAGIAQQQLLAAALQTTDFKFGDVANIISQAVQGGEITMDQLVEINRQPSSSAAIAAMEKFRRENKAKLQKLNTE